MSIHISATMLGDGVQIHYGAGDTALSFWISEADAEKLAFTLNVSLKEITGMHENQEQELYSHYQ
jgi:hypothetical protein